MKIDNEPPGRRFYGVVEGQNWVEAIEGGEIAVHQNRAQKDHPGDRYRGSNRPTIPEGCDGCRNSAVGEADSAQNSQ